MNMPRLHSALKCSPDIPFPRAESLLFGLEPTRLGVSRLIVPLEHFGWGTAPAEA